MNGLIMAAQLIAGLSILVTLHELGHFLAARAFGIKVEKFFLFFDAWGFKLLSIKIGETEYGIGWLPLGGYVKIAGMIDESMDTEQMKQPAQPWEFRSKPAWQRLIVMIAGVVVNLVLGIAIFWLILFKNGEEYIPASSAKHGIVAHELALQMGLKSGDKILAINGKECKIFEEVFNGEVLLGGANLKVLRGAEELNIKVPDNFAEQLADKGREAFIDQFPRVLAVVDSVLPESNAAKAGLQKDDKILSVNDTVVNYQDEAKAILVANKSKQIHLGLLRGTDTLKITANVDSNGFLGFNPKHDFNIETKDYSLGEALPVGTSKAMALLSNNVKGLGKVVTGQVKASKAVQGPIGIASLYGSTFDWLRFWTLTGVLSLILAFMNILPIPALDGGHTVFLIIEMIKGKPLSDKFMERAQMVGFVILLGLMVFAFGNDLLKIFLK